MHAEAILNFSLTDDFGRIQLHVNASVALPIEGESGLASPVDRQLDILLRQQPASTLSREKDGGSSALHFAFSRQIVQSKAADLGA